MGSSSQAIATKKNLFLNLCELDKRLAYNGSGLKSGNVCNTPEARRNHGQQVGFNYYCGHYSMENLYCK